MRNNSMLDLSSARRGLRVEPKVPLWKRVLDLTAIVLATPLVLPFLLLIALVIKIVSRGPVLFRQDRIGFSGKPFICFKFRTMRVGASTAIHQGYFKQLTES